MHISLSREEFAALLKLAAIGEAVTNDWTDPSSLTPAQQQANDALFALCARAAESGNAALAEQDETGEWGPSQQLIASTKEVLQRYDNDVFWDELVARLAHRDLTAEYGQATIDAMPDAYFRQAELPLTDYYWREVRTHGIDRLVLREDRESRQTRRPAGGRRPPRPASAADGTEDASSGA